MPVATRTGATTRGYVVARANRVSTIFRCGAVLNVPCRKQGARTWPWSSAQHAQRYTTGPAALEDSGVPMGANLMGRDSQGRESGRRWEEKGRGPCKPAGHLSPGQLGPHGLAVDRSRQKCPRPKQTADRRAARTAGLRPDACMVSSFRGLRWNSNLASPTPAKSSRRVFRHTLLS